MHPNGSGLCVVALSKNLKLTTTLDRAITQNPCYVPLNSKKNENRKNKSCVHTFKWSNAYCEV